MSYSNTVAGDAGGGATRDTCIGVLDNLKPVNESLDGTKAALLSVESKLAKRVTRPSEARDVVEITVVEMAFETVTLADAKSGCNKDVAFRVEDVCLTATVLWAAEGAVESNANLEIFRAAGGVGTRVGDGVEAIKTFDKVTFFDGCD